MENIKILVVEDDKHISLDIEIMINELGYEHLGTYTNFESALEAIYNGQPDLIIMDINIEGQKDGIDLAKEMVSLKIPIIFITAFESKSYFDRAKSLIPAAYLIKPFHMLTLQNNIELAVMKTHDNNLSDQSEWRDNISPQGTVFIKMNKVLHKVYVSQIYWIEVSGNYSYLFTKERKFILKMSLKKLLTQVAPHADFIRVHKQFVVQTKFINNVNPAKNTLKINDTSLPIGRRYKKELLNQIQSL